MGEFTWPVGVWSADGERLETVEALVDTGASYSMFPRSMLQRLGIEKRYVLAFEQADGRVVDRDVGQAMLVIYDSESSLRVIFGPEDADPLIGSNALQEFLLLVDPVAEELVPRTGRLKRVARSK